jgi:hypothetical protein
VLRLAGKTIAILALCSTVGLQWLALQSVAWTTMMISNARQVSFCEAMKRTFDGAHPCSLCHVVNKGKTSEQKRDIPASATQIDIVCVSRAIRLLPRVEEFRYAPRSPRISEIEYSPPAPPPRLALI